MSALAANALRDDPKIRDAVSICREITKVRAANFYWGLRLTPEPKRSAMYAIYAWMRKADDIVDSGASHGRDAEHGREEVAAFRRATVAALAGNCALDDPLWYALSAVARGYPLDADDFHVMLDGQLADLEPRRFTDAPQLRTYCEQVASSVGSLCVRIWGYSDPRALALARERGIAFQLTNILRDVVEDLSMGRVYVPQTEFDQAEVTAEQLSRWEKPQQCDALMRSMICQAREHFARSRPLDALIDPSCRPTSWALTEIYEQILERIARDPSQVARGRVSLSLARKVMIALRARRMGRAS